MSGSMLRTLVCLAFSGQVQPLAQGTNATLSGIVVDLDRGFAAGRHADAREHPNRRQIHDSEQRGRGVPISKCSARTVPADCRTAGFQTIVYNDLVLEVSAQVTHNLTLKRRRCRGKRRGHGGPEFSACGDDGIRRRRHQRHPSQRSPAARPQRAGPRGHAGGDCPVAKSQRHDLPSCRSAKIGRERHA